MLSNHTLAAMDGDDLAALLPHLREQTVERGQTLSAQGERVSEVYFPTTARLKNVVTFSDGRSAETFMIGKEGVSGLSPFLSDSRSGWAVEVGISGKAYHLPARVLRSRIDDSHTLRMQFNGLMNDYLTQASLGVACASLHSATSRLARFVLVTSERMEHADLHLTQQDLAIALALQRTTVSVSAAVLKSRKLIKYSRGVIRILNLSGLRDAACECYNLQQEVLDPLPRSPALAAA